MRKMTHLNPNLKNLNKHQTLTNIGIFEEVLEEGILEQSKRWQTYPKLVLLQISFKPTFLETYHVKQQSLTKRWQKSFCLPYFKPSIWGQNDLYLRWFFRKIFSRKSSKKFWFFSSKMTFNFLCFTHSNILGSLII